MTRISLCVTLLICAAVGCTRTPAWRPPFDGGHHISGGGASIFALGLAPDSQQSVVLYFPFDVDSEASHVHNAQTKTFDYSGTITRADAKPRLTYAISSRDLRTLTLNDVRYDLSKGMVFYVDENMNVEQCPFAGLEPSREYLDRLSEYFSTGRPSQTTSGSTPEG
jgi:hypothetical protein